MDKGKLEKICREVRKDIIEEVYRAGSGHPGGSLSAVEIMVTLFFDKMHIDPASPRMPDRDRFVLSKGHAAPVYYAVLAERGFFDKAELKTLRKYGSILQGHPDSKRCPGVDASSGSLGQGVSIATGMAIAAKKLDRGDQKVYTLIGDGEMQEGLCWEAFMAAAHYGLDNLTVILDHNGLQISGRNDDVMSLGDIPAKFRAFGFDVLEIDGNDLEAVSAALDKPASPGRPKCIIAETLKGKGVSFMEGQVDWHGKAPNEEQYHAAMKELEVS